jgi:hypothetical protein
VSGSLPAGAVALGPGEVHPLVSLLLSPVCALVRTSPDGLARLVAALDARRGEGTVLSRPSFEAAAAVVWVALDVGAARSDFGRARALMVISQTYFCYLGPDDDVTAPSATGTASPPAVATATPARRPSISMPIMATPADQHPPQPHPPLDRQVSAGASTSSASGGRRGVRKLYLQARVRHHAIWQDMQFWERAVFDSLGAEMNKIQDTR